MIKEDSTTTKGVLVWELEKLPAKSLPSSNLSEKNEQKHKTTKSSQFALCAEPILPIPPSPPEKVYNFQTVPFLLLPETQTLFWNTRFKGRTLFLSSQILFGFSPSYPESYDDLRVWWFPRWSEKNRSVVEIKVYEKNGLFPLGNLDRKNSQ